MKKLIELQKHFPLPDITFIIDLPTETASERMKKDGRTEHKFEANIEFQKKVREKYLEIKKYFPEQKIIIIDGSKPIEEIFEELKKECERFYI